MSVVSDSERLARRDFHLALPFGIIPGLGTLVSGGFALRWLLAGSFRRGRWGRWLIGLFAADVAVLACVIRLATAGPPMQAPAVQRARIGITTVEAPDGVGVERVVPGLPAERSGVKAGDVILAIDGRPVRTAQDVIAELNRRPDEERGLHVRRAEDLVDIRVTPVPPPAVDVFTVTPSGARGSLPRGWIVQVVITVLALAALAWRARSRAIAMGPAALVLFSLASGAAGQIAADELTRRALGGRSIGAWLLSVDAGAIALLLASAVSLRTAVRQGTVPAPDWRVPDLALVGRGLLYSIAFSVRALVLAFTAWSVTGLFRSSPPADPWSAAAGLPQAGTMLFAIGAVVVAPVGEELLFRGLLLPWLERFFSARAALAISAGLFALQHAAYGPGVVAVLVIGLVLGWARQRSGGGCGRRGHAACAGRAIGGVLEREEPCADRERGPGTEEVLQPG